MSESEFKNDVIIIGGGPVGVGLAIDLSVNGHRSIIVERHENIQRIPKGQNLTPRTGEHFQRWGVTDAIRAATPIPRDFLVNAGVPLRSGARLPAARRRRAGPPPSVSD